MTTILLTAVITAAITLFVVALWGHFHLQPRLKRAMKKWGEGEAGTAGGTELGFAVCKRGYRPFGEDGSRRYGCLKHHEMRLENMRKPPPRGAKRSEDGLYHRPGWERFDQWTFGEKNVVSESSSFLSIDSAEEGDLGRVAVDSPAKAKVAN